jgi:hypothetical protein
VKTTLLIAAALRLACPSLGPSTRALYARTIDDAVRDKGVDPYLVVAIVAHESRGMASADNGACVGLGQVCLSTQSACRDGLETPACLTRRAELFDGPTNLRVVVSMLATWKSYCKVTTGHASLRHILSGYAGVDGRGITCGQIWDEGWSDAPVHPIVKSILAIRRKIKP